ncbi:MAG TPA: aspartate kinase, partial [Saprospiraceae bacterium]|nr:aspartate kinase [Saprospiraceae bacterium]
MIVMKFGGTSVGNAERIHRLVEIVIKRSEEDQLVVVVSALEGITNLLEDACRKAASKNEAYRTSLDIIIRRHEECIGSIPFTPAISSDLIDQIREPLHRLGVICRGVSLVGDLTPKTKAHIMSFGEHLSYQIVHATMQLSGLNAAMIDSRDVIVTNEDYMSARVNYVDTNKKILQRITNEHRIFVVPGYVARSNNGEITTLGRGGSDYTASIFAAALDASRLEIWTDVNGMMSADPKHVKDTVTIPAMSYEEAM